MAVKIGHKFESQIFRPNMDVWICIYFRDNVKIWRNLDQTVRHKIVTVNRMFLKVYNCSSTVPNPNFLIPNSYSSAVSQRVKEGQRCYTFFYFHVWMLFSYPISELFFFVLCISARLSVHNSVCNQGFGNSSFLVRNQIKTKQNI